MKTSNIYPSQKQTALKVMGSAASLKNLFKNIIKSPV